MQDIAVQHSNSVGVTQCFGAYRLNVMIYFGYVNADGGDV
jgi:hypothetical protein